MPAVRRFDFAAAPSVVTKTPVGGYRLEARFTRVGVFSYTQADGTIVREFRSPEEVFHPDSIASLRGAAVTDLHPEGWVEPTSFQQLNCGTVLDATSIENTWVGGKLDVNAASLIAKIDGGEGKELSCGYFADVEPAKGEWNGEPYDAVQRNIRYNHVAIGPVGWGRGGPTVSLRLDSGDAIATTLHETPKPDTVRIMAKHKVDGIEYEAGSDSHLAAVNKHISTLVKRADEADAALAKAKKDAAEAVERATPKALAKRVAERVNLLCLARTHLGASYLKDEEEQTATSDDEVIKAVLAKLKPGLDTKNFDHAMLMGALLTCASDGAPAAPSEYEEPALPADGGAPPARTDARGKPKPGTPETSEDTEAKRAAERVRKDSERWKRGLPAYVKS